MTWNNVIATGSGKIAMRLEIAGHPIEFVTAKYLEGAGTDGRIRLSGLNLNSISWSETLKPTECKLNQSGFTATIVEDYDHLIGDSFTRLPSEDKTTYLSSTYEAHDDASIAVTEQVYVDNDVIYAGKECMFVLHAYVGGALDVTRNYRHSEAQAFYNDSIRRMDRAEVTDRRVILEGLTCYLYAYGDGETGNGTLVWTGIISTQPKLRSLNTWEVAIDGVSSILDQDLSSDLDGDLSVNGIYYEEWNAPRIHVTRHTSNLQTSAASADIVIIEPYNFIGYYTDQQDWCDAVTVAITSATAGWGANALNSVGGPKLEAVVDGDVWCLVLTTDTTAYWHSITVMETVAKTGIDPYMSSGVYLYDLHPSTRTSSLAVSTAYHIPSSESTEFPIFGATIAPPTTPVTGAGTVPRGWIGSKWHPPIGTQLANRFYPNRTISLQAGDAILVEWPANDDLDAINIEYNILVDNTVNLYATIEHLFDRSPRSIGRRYTRDSIPKAKVSRVYVENGCFYDFINEILAGSAEYSSIGAQPYLTSNHLDISEFNKLYIGITSIPWLASRYYGAASKCSLATFFAEELKLLGAVPSITTNGRLGCFYFKPAISTMSAVKSIESSNILSAKQLPGYEPVPYGIVNTIQMKTDYDVISGEHKGDTYMFRDANSLSRNPIPRLMKIEPRSKSTLGDGSISRDDIVNLCSSWTKFLGTSYTTYTVLCDLSTINCVLGSNILLTISQVPNQQNGGRGMTTLPSLVVGRKVNIIEGTVEITAITTISKNVGYSPSSDIDFIDDLGGGNWNVYLVTPTLPVDNDIMNYAGVESWAVDDVIRIVQFNTATPTENLCTITGITIGTNLLTVSAAGAIPTLPATVEYANASEITTTQQRYGFIANDHDRIEFTVEKTAREFA
jgi:hypothetical protein